MRNILLAVPLLVLCATVVHAETNEAKALYEKLAARSDEDQGKSPWPSAAAHRLTWWIEG